MLIGVLWKNPGGIQASMYNPDKEKILHLYELCVPIQKIISTHLGYGKYLSLKAFLKKCDILRASSEKN